MSLARSRRASRCPFYCNALAVNTARFAAAAARFLHADTHLHTGPFASEAPVGSTRFAIADKSTRPMATRSSASRNATNSSRGDEFPLLSFFSVSPLSLRVCVLLSRRATNARIDYRDYCKVNLPIRVNDLASACKSGATFFLTGVRKIPSGGTLRVR
jgi:hypothetical protein